MAILAVVLIHTTTRTLEASNAQILSFPFTFTLNQAARFAVPLFFLISGFVLEVNYPFHLSYLSYLKKRLSKIFIPYLFWSAIYYLFIYRTHGVDFISALLGGNASYQLYFIPTLLIFYLLFPLLHKLYFFLSKKFIFIPIVILELLLIGSDYYLRPLHIFYPIDIALLNFVYFIGGMIASHHISRLHMFAKRNLLFLFILTVASAAFTTLEGAYLYLKNSNYLDYYSSWRPVIFLYTIVLALLLWIFFEKSKRLQHTLHLMSKLSFFVFFIHVAILELYWSAYSHQLFELTKSNSVEKVFSDVVFYVSVVITSYIVAYVIHKLPFLSKVTG